MAYRLLTVCFRLMCKPLSSSFFQPTFIVVSIVGSSDYAKILVGCCWLSRYHKLSCGRSLRNNRIKILRVNLICSDNDRESFEAQTVYNAYLSFFLCLIIAPYLLSQNISSTSSIALVCEHDSIQPLLVLLKNVVMNEIYSTITFPPTIKSSFLFRLIQLLNQKT